MELLQPRVTLRESIGVLVLFCHGQQLTFTEKFADEGNARRRAAAGKSIGHNHAGMPREIAQ